MTEAGRHIPLETWLAARTEAKDLAMGRSDRLSGILPGLYRSFFKGRGLEYDESRRYQAGDDFSQIDWRVSARTGQIYTKSFREEREHTILFALDMSQSMQFGTRRCVKWVRGAELMALIAWLAVDNGDRVGGVLYGLADGIKEHRPTLGEVASLRLYKTLERASQGEAAPNANLPRAIARIRRHASHGSVVILLSDFRNVTNEDLSHLSELSQKNDVTLVHLHDPLEQVLPSGQALNFATPEGTKTLYADDVSSRKHHQQAFAHHRERLETFCWKIGARFMSASTQEHPLPALITWSQGRGAHPSESRR